MSTDELTLNVKGEYYQQFLDGDKPFEYRLYNDYWKKRLVGRTYNTIRYSLGYPKRCDEYRNTRMPYTGYEIQEINHPHFGNEPVKVFAIRLNTERRVV